MKKRCNAREDGRIGDDETEVDVDRRGDAGFELEVTKLHGLDLMEIDDEILHSWLQMMEKKRRRRRSRREKGGERKDRAAEVEAV